MVCGVAPLTQSEMIIAIDTRERKPYQFERSEVKTLSSGDYSIIGLENRVAVERKTKADAYASLGTGRARFKRAVQRLSEFDFAAIVIESSLQDFLVPPPFTRMRPRSAVGSLLAWTVKFGVPTFFADDRRLGRAVTRQLLRMYWRYYKEGCFEHAH